MMTPCTVSGNASVARAALEDRARQLFEEKRIPLAALQNRVDTSARAVIAGNRLDQPALSAGVSGASVICVAYERSSHGAR